MARRCSAERAAQGMENHAKIEKNVMIQFAGKEIAEQEVIEKVKADVVEKGINEKAIEKLDLYIKPEEDQTYYVVNGTITGCISL